MSDLGYGWRPWERRPPVGEWLLVHSRHSLRLDKKWHRAKLVSENPDRWEDEGGIEIPDVRWWAFSDEVGQPAPAPPMS